jgi:hypothetical protein
LERCVVAASVERVAAPLNARQSLAAFIPGPGRARAAYAIAACTAPHTPIAAQCSSVSPAFGYGLLHRIYQDQVMSWAGSGPTGRRGAPCLGHGVRTTASRHWLTVLRRMRHRPQTVLRPETAADHG